MLEKFLKQTVFTSQEDFMKNFHVNVPENFNFGYDVVDAWAAEQPDKKAILWVGNDGQKIDFTFADIKRESDRAASFFKSLGIEKGDRVMLILKRHYEFWFSIIALHKIGAVCIPATHLLMAHDIVYRNNSAGIKMIVACGDKETGITVHVADAQLDHGCVLFQAKCPVERGDTPEDVAARVHKLEYAYFPEVIERFCQGRYDYKLK